MSQHCKFGTFRGQCPVYHSIGVHRTGTSGKNMKTIEIVTIAVAVVLFAATMVSAKQGVYARLGLGATFSRDTKFADENCTSTNPPALFGCNSGPDGRSIGARGDFGSSMLIDAGLGYDLGLLRLEATLGWRPGFAFSGQANFLNVPLDSQPVSGDVDSKTAMVGAYLDLASLAGKIDARFHPFLGAAMGIARNSVDSMQYLFPTISQDAVTWTPSGSWTGFTWAVTAGISISLPQNLTLDIGYRYQDLGTVRTDTGTATIVRPTLSQPLELTIAPTEASLRAHDVYASVRYAF